MHNQHKNIVSSYFECIIDLSFQAQLEVRYELYTIS